MALALHHAIGAYRVADEIARRRVDVVALPLFLRIGISEEAMRSPTILARAGLWVAFHQDDPVSGTKLLRYNGSLAMRYEMAEADALKGLTINAGGSRRWRIGSGASRWAKDADRVVLSGPWHELATRVDLVLVDGVVAYDRSQEERE